MVWFMLNCSTGNPPQAAAIATAQQTSTLCGTSSNRSCSTPPRGRHSRRLSYHVAKFGVLLNHKVLESPISLKLAEDSPWAPLIAVLNDGIGRVVDGDALLPGSEAPLKVFKGCDGEGFIKVDVYMGKGQAHIAGNAIDNLPGRQEPAVERAVDVMK